MSLRKATLAGARPKRAQCKAGGASDEGGLVAQAKSGCTSAFGQLYERHRVKVYHTIFRVIRQKEDAEDAVQRCFQRAFTNLARFREDSTFLTWLTRIAINEALMLLRQRRTKISFSDAWHEDTESPFVVKLAHRAPTPEQIAAANELGTVLMQAILDLRESLRSVVLLRELQGLTNEETARRLGLSVAAVKSRVFHARRWLRRRLKRRLQPTRNGFRFDWPIPAKRTG